MGGLLVGGSGFEVASGAMVIIEAQVELTPEPGSPVHAQIDIDGDGDTEVGLVVGTASYPDSTGHDGVARAFGIYGAELAFSSGLQPALFRTGASIGASLDFSSKIGILAWSSGWVLGDRGNWLGGEEAYFGVRFLQGENLLYGWLHAIWEPEAKTLTIDRIGYDDSGAAAVIPAEPEPEFVHRYGAQTDVDSGLVEVVWPAVAGRTYVVQRSLGLQGWTTIHTEVAGADGERSYLDDEFAGAPKARCFYRVGQQLGSPFLLLALGMRRRGNGAPSSVTRASRP